MANYRPQLFMRTADVTVGLTFPEGTSNPEEKMVRRFELCHELHSCAHTQVMPGDNVELICSLGSDLGCEVGTRYAVRLLFFTV